MNKISLILCLFIFACSTNDRLEKALVMSGSNRVELEKVLAHYSKDEADSLKLRAARFLIENMPGHYTYQGEGLTSYIKQLDSLNPKMLFYTKGYFYSLYYANDPYRIDLLTKRYDIEHINSDFLIKNIDFKFKLFDGSLFEESITFDDFLDYLLPYRVDIESLIDIEQDTLNKIAVNSLDAYNLLDNYNISTPNLLYLIQLNVFNQSQGFIQMPNNETYSMISCDAMSLNNAIKYRLIGVPITLDFTPHWANYNGRHKWNKVIDISDKKVVLNYLSRYKISKIYRKTYSHNPSPRYEENLIPFIFNPFSKDVTSEYIQTADVMLSYKDCVKKNIKNVYLSVFNELMWQAVAWSEVDGKGVANFRDVGKGIVYLPIYYYGNDEIVNDYPFILTNNGSLHKLVPNHEKKIAVNLKRKFPYNENKMRWDKDLIGAVIEGANNPMFNNSDTLFIIQNKAVYSSHNISIKNSEKYKYIRVGKNLMNNGFSLAELSFSNTHGEKIDYEPFRYDYSGSPEKNYYGAVDLKKTLSDSNYSTYKTILTMMVEFKNRTDISSVNLGTLGDNNDIYPDNVYELMYYDKEGWVSMGVKTATDYFIEYDNVPSGALYWLRNLTIGKEERIFTYENGEMKFW